MFRLCSKLNGRPVCAGSGSIAQTGKFVLVIDWLFNLPVVWMTLVALGGTYLCAGVIYWVVTALAVGERARAFKGVSPGLLPPLGIIFGLFVYIVLVVGTGGSYAGYKGSIALALLMLPVVVRATEVVLLLVPDGLREAALALGAPRWRVIGRVVLPTALPGMVTGVLLAVARAAGETAPLLFTAAATMKTNYDLGGFMNSLPVQIYNDVTSPTTAVVNRAWGAALTLVVMILLLNVAARTISRRSRLT
jgi:ABC-type spermidine/putrescine transport system permease subunit II